MTVLLLGAERIIDLTQKDFGPRLQFLACIVRREEGVVKIDVSEVYQYKILDYGGMLCDDQPLPYVRSKQ